MCLALHRQHRAVTSSDLYPAPQANTWPSVTPPHCYKAAVYDALQPPDFFLTFCCPVGYSPVLLPTSHFALHLHLFLLSCILLLSNHFSGSQDHGKPGLQSSCSCAVLERTGLPSAAPAVIQRGQTQNWMAPFFL